jgi:hypothetical protein
VERQGSEPTPFALLRAVEVGEGLRRDTHEVSLGGRRQATQVASANWGSRRACGVSGAAHAAHGCKTGKRFPFPLDMARPLRFLPDGAMVEVTMRTVHGRFLLRPSRTVNDLNVGVIGRAQGKYGMKPHAAAVSPRGDRRRVTVTLAAGPLATRFTRQVQSLGSTGPG